MWMHELEEGVVKLKMAVGMSSVTNPIKINHAQLQTLL
jgi:hypothetical protein